VACKKDETYLFRIRRLYDTGVSLLLFVST
jgi:hypothetical protein